MTNSEKPINLNEYTSDEQLVIVSNVSGVHLLVAHGNNADTRDLDDINDALGSRAAILEFTNGIFDPYEPILVQVGISTDELKLFDLINVINDKPAKNRDKKKAKKLFDSDFDEHDHDTLCRQVYLAKTFKPKLNSRAKEALVDFYVKVRNPEPEKKDEFMPVLLTPRELKTMKKLTEGFAKLRFSERADAKDAAKAIEVFKYLFRQLSIDIETSELIK